MNAEQIAKLKRAIDCLEILDKRPRPMCRDCADEDGTCPTDGLDCDMRKLIADTRAILAAAAPHAQTEPVALPVTPKHIEEIKDLLLWPVTEDDARAARDMLQSIHFDLSMAEPWPGYVIAPDYRGYAHLGLGRYILTHSRAGDPPELVISIATEPEKVGRVIGDLRDTDSDEPIQPEVMAVRMRFENAAGLGALEQQLRILREVHFPQPNADCSGDPKSCPDNEGYGCACDPMNRAASTKKGGA